MDYKNNKMVCYKFQKAQVWTGLQSYNSDDDVSKLSASALLKDSNAAVSGGATGVIMFRWGLSSFFDFSKL